MPDCKDPTTATNLHPFPSPDSPQRELWELGTGFINPYKFHKVCSLHFAPDEDFDDNGLLRPDAVPKADMFKTPIEEGTDELAAKLAEAVVKLRVLNTKCKYLDSQEARLRKRLDQISRPSVNKGSRVKIITDFLNKKNFMASQVYNVKIKMVHKIRKFRT